MFANLTDRILFAISGLSRQQYLHRKADQFLAKALPDIVELTEKALSSIMMGHPKVVKTTLYPQCNDTEYINILIERLQNCGLKVEINNKGPHFHETLEVGF